MMACRDERHPSVVRPPGCCLGDASGALSFPAPMLRSLSFPPEIPLQAKKHRSLLLPQNNKDYFDQSLDEVKLLKLVNAADPADEHGILRLYDYFYFKEHLMISCELLKANLYEFQKYNRDSGDPPFFTVPRLQSIARQVLQSLAFLHSLKLIHSDLKPENILIKSYSR